MNFQLCRCFDEEPIRERIRAFDGRPLVFFASNQMLLHKKKPIIAIQKAVKVDQTTVMSETDLSAAAARGHSAEENLICQPYIGQIFKTLRGLTIK